MKMATPAVERRAGAAACEFSYPSAHETQMTRIFRAPPSRVFQLFFDPATVPVLWDVEPKRVTVDRLDLRVGGAFAITVRRDGETPRRFQGEFTEVVPGRRVVQRWHEASRPDHGVVETDEFEPVGDSTRVTIRWKVVNHSEPSHMAGPGFEAMLGEQAAAIDRLLAAEA